MIVVVWSCDGFGKLTWVRVLCRLDADVKEDFTLWTLVHACRLDWEKTEEELSIATRSAGGEVIWFVSPLSGEDV